ncbi:MAG: putative hydro-lyase [Burkholderiales bacterium]|nr:putative hydro-lyase [Burkholderiales bacterium]
MRSLSLEARLAIRRGAYTGPTPGLAPGHVQGNLAVLPASFAPDFLRYCQLNPKPCPLIGMTEPGDWRIPALGADLDVRTDIPGYCLFRDGEPVADLRDLMGVWRGDLVAFVIGCSFSFEEALLEAQVPVRHIECGSNVPMYRSGIATTPAGPFGGPMVVSMRPMKPADAIRAIQVTSRFPGVHGAPVHFGDPEAIGIADIARPDFGDPVEIRAGEVPVFWACGVTPQSAIRAARPAIAITHKPGCMLVTDLRNAQLASF